MEPTDLSALLAARRSTKSFAEGPVDACEIQGVLTAAFGVGDDGHRTYGSAHARYPVTATLVAGNVAGLSSGSYRITGNGDLHNVGSGQYREIVARATLDAVWAATCPALLVLSADLAAEDAEFAWQSKGRGERFVAMEIGLIAQTVHLAAAARGLGTVLVAGVNAEAARRLPESIVPSGEELIAVMPLGRPAKERTDASPRLDRGRREEDAA